MKWKTLDLIYFGQKHTDFNANDLEFLYKIKRLANKHHKQSENSCNGCGIVKGQAYTVGSIDNGYAKRLYGNNVKSAYLSEDYNVFDREIENTEKKITDLINRENRKIHVVVNQWTVEFQGDPRGNTVALSYDSQCLHLDKF